MTVKPRALRRGDLVGVCAPSGPVDTGRMERGIAELEGLGLRVRVAEGTLGRRFFTSGPTRARADDLLALLSDDDVAAVVCARGGAGAGGLLPLLAGEPLSRRTKVFVGCSDITALHLLLRRQGLVVVHGPMVAGDLADGSYDRPSFRHALLGEGEPYRSGPDDLIGLRAGRAEGVLEGGCLALLAAAAGTPEALRASPAGALLFIEDVRERPFRIDRMLRHLRRAGAFLNVRGVVFGDMKGCAPKLDEPYSLEDVLLDALEGLDVPIALGLSSGHTTSPAVSLPLGVRARLEVDAEGARFEVLEAATA